MEPDGRFVLMALPDGRTIADLKLSVEPTLSEITLLDSGGQYFLLACGSSGLGDGAVFARRLTGGSSRSQPIYGGSYEWIDHGRLYAFDRQGKLSWPAPAEIEKQFMLIRQPSQLPVLTFARQVYYHTAGSMSSKVSILCIDKRNGRKIYKAGFETPTGIVRVAGDAEKKTVNVTTQQKTVTLTFTDKPIPRTTNSDEAANSSNNSARALWNAIQKVLGLSDDSAPDED